MIWNRKPKTRTKDVHESVKTAEMILNSQQKHVTAVSSWLERRKNQNGFGEDFEFTLIPRGSK